MFWDWAQPISLLNEIYSQHTGKSVDEIKSALEREESRGGHTRLDYPEERKDLINFNVVIKKDNNGNMAVERKTKIDPPQDLYAIANSTLEDLENNE